MRDTSRGKRRTMARAGRKRKHGVKRQPNGQPVRSQHSMEEDAMSVVIDARRRFYGLGKDNAKSDLAGYVIGRMALKGHFGESYMWAINIVEDYCRTVADYSRLKLPMSPIPKAMDYFAAR